AGAGWGFSMPLAKIAVSEDYRHLGIIFWQTVIGAALLFSLTRLRGKRIPWERAHVRSYLIVALLGTVLPNTASFEAARHLPAGVVSICIAMVPMFAFPIAILLGNERFQALRESKGLDNDGLLLPERIADTYYHVATQHRSAWTHELDLRAFSDLPWWNH
ncbi:MAG: EamA family transporter, partial [Pseudomonadota bacterium]